jgi:hypothetical protein
VTMKTCDGWDGPHPQPLPYEGRGVRGTEPVTATQLALPKLRATEPYVSRLTPLPA